jgi:hypothetical protein
LPLILPKVSLQRAWKYFSTHSWSMLFNISVLNDLTDILKIIPRMNRFENRYVCSEYVNFRRTSGSSYNHKSFLKNLAKDKQKFILATQEQEKLADMFRVLAK